MRGHSNQLPVDPQTDGGKLQAARLAQGLSLSAISYDGGYLSRVERNVLPVTPGILVAYERVTGHPIPGVTPQGKGRPSKEQRKRQTRQALIPQALDVLSKEWIQRVLGDEIVDLLFDLLQEEAEALEKLD